MHIDSVRFSSGIYQKSDDGERQQYTWQSNKSYLLVNIHHTYKLQVQETRIKCTILWRLMKYSINCVCSAVFAFVGECLAHKSVGSIFILKIVHSFRMCFSSSRDIFPCPRNCSKKYFHMKSFLCLFLARTIGTKETLICSYWPFSNASLISKKKKKHSKFELNPKAKNRHNWHIWARGTRSIRLWNAFN